MIAQISATPFSNADWKCICIDCVHFQIQGVMQLDCGCFVAESNFRFSTEGTEHYLRCLPQQPRTFASEDNDVVQLTSTGALHVQRFNLGLGQAPAYCLVPCTWHKPASSCMVPKCTASLTGPRLRRCPRTILRGVL